MGLVADIREMLAMPRDLVPGDLGTRGPGLAHSSPTPRPRGQEELDSRQQASVPLWRGGVAPGADARRTPADRPRGWQRPPLGRRFARGLWTGTAKFATEALSLAQDGWPQCRRDSNALAQPHTGPISYVKWLLRALQNPMHLIPFYKN
jgi:hypothetical protein